MKKIFEMAGLMLLWVVATAVSARGADKPNIVFILTDDLGINDLGCYGRKDHHTPRLDKLATEGMRFTSSYCALPICSPTRAALMTGKSPARLHITTFLPGRPDTVAQKLKHPLINQQLPLEEKTIGEYMKEAGYATGYFGKWHLGGAKFDPSQQGFDLYFPGSPNTKPSATEGGKGEYQLTARAEQFIEANKARPFFAYISHNTPHIPFTAKPELIEKNKDAWYPEYAAVIESMDECVGRIVDTLDRLGLAQNTLLVFTSDNGGLHVPELKHSPATHNTPYRAGKGFVYEGGLRVPLIVRWPGMVKPGTVMDTPVISTDWLPTLMQCVGSPVKADLDGVSFMPLLTGGLMQDRALFWHYPHYCNQGAKPAGAVREGQWKLVEQYEDGSLELYDLSRDASESQNVAAEHADIAKRMRDALHTWLKSSGAQENTLNPEFQLAWHKKLYDDVDVSKLKAGATSDETGRAWKEWRAGMDSVVKDAKMEK